MPVSHQNEQNTNDNISRKWPKTLYLDPMLSLFGHLRANKLNFFENWPTSLTDSLQASLMPKIRNLMVGSVRIWQHCALLIMWLHLSKSHYGQHLSLKLIPVKCPTKKEYGHLSEIIQQTQINAEKNKFSRFIVFQNSTFLDITQLLDISRNY